jgi:hypothetical protein
MVVVQPAAAGNNVVWTGNGTNNGFCSDVSQDPSVPPGMQQWLFILTSPGSGPWTLTANFQNSGQKTASGVQQGNGSVHFTVLTSAGDQLLSASATNGTASSVLTVSHCEVGPPPPSTTSPPTTSAPPTTVVVGPPGAPSVPGAVGAPSAAAAVTGQPLVTG